MKGGFKQVKSKMGLWGYSDPLQGYKQNFDPV